VWRGGRDRFRAGEFHSRCDGRANTLTLIQDTKGNNFGGFTPVEWESAPGEMWGHTKGDDSLRSFLFMLENPDGVPPRKFALRAEEKQEAIWCDSALGPAFGEACIWVSNKCTVRRGISSRARSSSQ
jgi:hypothetical protein